jgi:hypothetical protein
VLRRPRIAFAAMRSEQAAPAAPAAPARSTSQAPLYRRALAHPRAPVVALALGTLIVMAVIVDVGLRVSGWALDETIIKQSALHYRHGLPGTLFHDLNARATSRLFSLLLMPVFAIWDGDTAVRIAHAISGVIFCTTSIPVYLLARRIVRSPWFAAAAGVLAISGPWVTLGTTIYTENLALPLFMWTVLAMVWALGRPGIRSELVVLAGIFLCTVTRVQLFALLPGWLITVWVVSAGRTEDRRAFARSAWRAAPITLVLFALGIVFAIFRWETGHFHADVQRLLGAYSELQDRGHLSADTFLAVAYEIQAMALPAFLAAVAAIAWCAGTLRAPRTTQRWAFAVTALCVTAVLWLISAYVQGGFLGGATEERYFFYVFPLIWIAAFAAIEEPAVTGPRLVAAAIPLILLFATLGQPRPLDPQSDFLAPATAVVGNMFTRLDAHISGLSTRDALTVVAIFLAVVAIWVWRRFPPGRLAAFIVVPALLQLFITGYAIAARDGGIPGVQGQTGGIIPLNAWVDHHAGKDDVTWINNQAWGIAPDAGGWQYATLFWNSRIRQWATDATSGVPTPVATIAALPARNIAFDTKSGYISGLEHAGPFVSYIDSPFFQISGQQIASGPGSRLNLVAPSEPVHAIWRARPLFSDGSISPKTPPALDAWLPPGSNAKRLRVMIELVAPASGPIDDVIRIGSDQKEVKLQPNQVKQTVFETCVTGRHAGGTVKVVTAAPAGTGQPVGGRISIVRVRPIPGGHC